MRTVFYVIAPTSSGKTTAALRLSDELAIPVVHADSVYHYLRDKLATDVPAGKLTDYRHWGNPAKFGLESWLGHRHLNDIKPPAYRELVRKVEGDFIIEGFTLSFLCERAIVADAIGPHKSVLVRIKTDFETWTQLYIARNGDETVVQRKGDFDRLTNCFECLDDEIVVTFPHPGMVSKSALVEYI